MITETFANEAQSTLGSSIGPFDIVLVIPNPSAFPPTGNFRIKIDNELMQVTARTGGALSVVRGIEGTTPVGHSLGALVEVVLTAKVMNDIRTDLDPFSKGVKLFGAVGDGATDDTAAIQAAASGVQDLRYPLSSGDYYVNTTASVGTRSNVHRFPAGSGIQVGAGKTLTLHGSIDAKRHQIFFGSGTVFKCVMCWIVNGAQSYAFVNNSQVPLGLQTPGGTSNPGVNTGTKLSLNSFGGANTNYSSCKIASFTVCLGAHPATVRQKAFWLLGHKYGVEVE